jgi:hypothetical protein
VFTIDAPDASALAAFYAELLALDTLAEGDGYAMIGKEGTTSIGFTAVEDFAAPPWPDTGRKQFHLEVAATDIEVRRSDVRRPVALPAPPREGSC